MDKPELTSCFEVFNNSNMSTLDEFLAKQENYNVARGRLNIERTAQTLGNIKVLYTMPSVVEMATSKLTRTHSTSQSSSSSNIEQEAAAAGEAEVELKLEIEEQLRGEDEDEDEEELIIPVSTQPPKTAATNKEYELVEQGCVMKLRWREAQVDEETLPTSEHYGFPLKRTRFGRSCYVGNLPPDVLAFELLDLFAPFGRVVEVCLDSTSSENQPPPPASGGRVSALVTYESRESARTAIQNVSRHLSGFVKAHF